MDSNYHIFKKSVKSKGKTVHKWYCYWNDPVTGVMHQKVCKGCKTQAEAYAFVSALPPIFVEEKITIAKIAEWLKLLITCLNKNCLVWYTIFEEFCLLDYTIYYFEV